MPVAKFNYTGRRRIDHTHAVISINKRGEDVFWFDADIDLSSYDGLRGDALVFVEAYRQTQYARFPFGTVDDIEVPPEGERVLSGKFSEADSVLFRVKVVEPESALVLAQANRIAPEIKGAKTSILPVMAEDLGQQCWSVNFDEEPVLQINKKISPDWRTAARSPVLVAVAYPAVVREILGHIMRVEEHFHTDEKDNWCSLWLRLAQDKFGAGVPPSPDDYDDGKVPEEEIENWIDRAVSGFARNVRAFSKYEKEYDDSVS